VWQGESWKVRVHEIRLPDGALLERGSIDHPGAVVLVPLTFLDGRPQVLMVRQYRLAIDEVILEVPAGTRRLEEDWLDCAQRELREETGFRAKQFLFLGEMWPAPGVSNERLRLYLATELSSAPLPQDVDEELQVQRLPLDLLVSMAKDGRLQDAKSIVAILRTAHHLEQGPPVAEK
jgi:ADP-ribose pyrophosphatase